MQTSLLVARIIIFVGIDIYIYIGINIFVFINININVREYFEPLTKQYLEKCNICIAFLASRIDDSNSLFIGWSRKAARQLQLIQQKATRVLTFMKRTDHIAPVLQSLNWLPVSYIVYFKVLRLV